MKTIRYTLLLLAMMLRFVMTVYAQLDMKLVEEDIEEELIFHAPRHINLVTVESLEKNTLH